MVQLSPRLFLLFIQITLTKIFVRYNYYKISGTKATNLCKQIYHIVNFHWCKSRNIVISCDQHLSCYLDPPYLITWRQHVHLHVFTMSVTHNNCASNRFLHQSEGVLPKKGEISIIFFIAYFLLVI